MQYVKSRGKAEITRKHLRYPSPRLISRKNYILKKEKQRL